MPTSLSAIEGHAYTTTGENASGDPLVSIEISNPPWPQNPIATDSASFTDNPKPKSYGVHASENYVYIATSKNLVDIINTETMTRAGYFDTGNRDGNTVYVSGNIGYATSSTTLYAFSLSGSINPAPLLASTTIAGLGKRLVVIGNYAYLVTDNTSKQLQIFDVTNAETGLITLAGELNLGNGQQGVDAYISTDGNLAYIVTKYASPDFFIINVSNKSTPSLVGTFTTSNNMIPYSVTVIPQDSRAIIVGSGSDLYQVLNISTPTSPARCSPQLNFSGVSTLYAVSAVTEADGDAYAYILTSDASREFQMIRGGPGGGGSGSALSGIFDSQVFDPGGSATFNRFDSNTVFPSGTYTAYQVAITNKVGGVCPSVASGAYEFVGWDRTRNTSFPSPTGSTQIPLGTDTGFNNPGECFRYRVILSTDNLGTTPSFNDITINYSL